MTKIAYTAGKYRAETLNGVRINTLRAEAIAIKYWELGYGVICPHKNCFMIDCESVNDDLIMEADLIMIQRCVDVMIMIPGWEDSEGAIKEHNLAVKLGIKIIYETEETIMEYLHKVIGGTRWCQQSNGYLKRSLG